MKKLAVLFTLSLVLATPIASALTQSEARECKALAASFAPAKTAIEAKLAKREGLAAEAEAAGEAWENAENIRTLSRETAKDAEALKKIFQTRKADFERFEADLQSASEKLNADFNRFNTLCAAG